MAESMQHNGEWGGRRGFLRTRAVGAFPASDSLRKRLLQRKAERGQGVMNQLKAEEQGK